MRRSEKKVVVGMSGGVDSSLSAALLVEAGYKVTGVFLECWKEPGCRTDKDRKDALQVALKLKIPFKVLDFKKEYKARVVDYFYKEYKAGRTPNPDVVCNKEIKFGLFYDWALENGFDYLATGHYARIKKEGNELNLMTGVDKKKDQTYFLYRLRQEQLFNIMFPIGEMTKNKVRVEAEKRSLHTAGKPDSQGICFIGEVDVGELLEKKLGKKKGKVVDTKSNVIGEHDGVWFYTIGQRHGFRLSSKKGTLLPPFYVISKNVKRNELLVGFGAETYRNQFEVDDLNWLDSRFKIHNSRWVKGIKTRVRHGGKLLDSVIKADDGRMQVKLKEPQRGIAPGQSGVFYLPYRQAGTGNICLGGGTIAF